MNNYINKSLWFLPLIIVFGLFAVKSYACFDDVLTKDCKLMAQYFMKGGCNTKCILEYSEKVHPVNIITAALLMGGVVWEGTDGTVVDVRNRGDIPQDALSIIHVKKGALPKNEKFNRLDARVIGAAVQKAKQYGFNTDAYQRFLHKVYGQFGPEIHANVWPIVQGNPGACV